MQLEKGNLIPFGLNTPNQTIYFNGVKVQGYIDFRANTDAVPPLVVLKVVKNANPPEFIASIRSAGVIVKERAA